MMNDLNWKTSSHQFNLKPQSKQEIF